jgi:hypothetical protein
VHFVELTEKEHSEKLNKPHNPYDSQISDEEFLMEYDLLFERIEAILSEFGKNDPYGQGDYNLEPATSGKSRGFGVEISNAKMLTKVFLLRLQMLLRTYAPMWEIYLRSDQYNYGIFVAADTIRFYRNTDQLLPRLP